MKLSGSFLLGGAILVMTHGWDGKWRECQWLRIFWRVSPLGEMMTWLVAPHMGFTIVLSGNFGCAIGLQDTISSPGRVRDHGLRMAEIAMGSVCVSRRVSLVSTTKQENPQTTASSSFGVTSTQVRKKRLETERRAQMSRADFPSIAGIPAVRIILRILRVALCSFTTGSQHEDPKPSRHGDN